MGHNCLDEEASTPPSPATNQKQHHHAPSSSIIITNSIGMALNGFIAGATGFLLLLLLKIYGPSVMNEGVQAAFTYIFLAAYIVGEIGFGLLIDHIGRKKGLVIVASLILLGSIGLTSSHGTTPNQLVWLLIGFRVIIGIAQGGEYPCSAVSTTESTTHIKAKRRGMVIIGTTYLMVALGYIITPVVTVILVAIFKDNLEPTWRLLVGLPIIPTAYILYYRIFHIPNEQRKRPNDEKGNTHTKSSTWIFFRRYWFRVMIPTIVWMSYNFIFYPASVFSTLILDKVADDASIISTLSWNILIFSFYLVGQSISCITVDTLGRRWTAMLGLFGQALVAFIVGGCYQQLTSNCFPLFVFLYGALLGFGELSGMIPSICLTEYTPRDYRGTVYGIGSGFAKAAGLVGVVTHSYMKKQFGIDGEFIIFGILASLSGITVLLFLQETSGPGVMEKADEEFEHYLETRSKSQSMGSPLGVQQQ